ncbi:ubiquitin carboxyl-terminal hydrolase-like protein [Thozetella sp. PMI_491]|nr:ubiquitin carboxyl-terminal hydrolase-like protein [Thozetella sp. PMI_491]
MSRARPNPEQSVVAIPSRGDALRPVERVTDQLETPSLDDRTYRVVRLPNELEVLLVHDPNTDKASAAMDVAAGSFSDEPHMPGMAHAVEHLLFMGTKKYPAENAYSQYLSANSGSSNAYTAATHTNYYFDVTAKPSNDEEPSASNPSPLLGALDRFAQFFVEPLFLANTLDRELRAVDSENKKNLQSDQWRLNQLEKSISNPNHPYCHFSTGNYEVLKEIPDKQGVNVRDKFIQFYETHYSANLMKLCVLGREPLDVLEAWASEFFAGIKNKNLQPGRWSDEVPLTADYLGLQCFAKPVMDSRELNLLFPFLDEEDLCESQPSRYISHLIGHEGPGSIMAYIKSKGWANGLSAGSYATCPGSPGLFDCQIRLTEEGLKNYKEVVKVFFQYVALLHESPPQKWIFEEMQGMAEVDFKFKQKTPASNFTGKISATMQRPLPREWLLSAYSRLRKFDPAVITEGLNCLRPDNFRMTIVSRDFPGTWDKKERWYGTEYTHEKIPADFMAEIKKAASSSAKERIPSLHLPHKNNFIPTKLEVQKKEVKEAAPAPRMVRNDQLARTWFKKDDTFWVPKANLIVSCKSPMIYASAENSVKARLFTDLVRDALEEYSYDAELAGLQYTISLDGRGLYIEVSGYNDKLPVLLEQVLITMRDLEIRDDRFDIIKERLSRGYRNWELQQPFTQVSDYTSWLVAEHDFVTEELALELPGIKAGDVRIFKKQLLSQLHMEAYVHGNLYKEDALKLTDMIESTLKPRVLARAHWPIRRSLILPPGCNYLYKKALSDPANVNHCIEYWLYVGDKANRDLRAKTQLLDQILHEPAFDQLRTKEQLGYIVYSGLRSTITNYGLRFIIQSEKTCPYLDQRIDSFLETYTETLTGMSESDFDNHKRSLIVRRLEKPKYLDQETSKHWTQISQEYYDFQAAQHDAAQIKSITKEDLVQFYMHYIHPSSKHRAKLAIYLVAQAKSDVSTKQISDLVKTLDLDAETARKAATDLQARLTAADHDIAKEIEGLTNYLLHDLMVPETQLKTAAEAWKKIHSSNGNTNGLHEDATSPALNGIEPVLIEDIRTYKAGLVVSPGAKPPVDLSDHSANSPSDVPLPSTEQDADPALVSFSSTFSAGSLGTPSYVRGDSLPASGVPPRLQTQQSSFTAPDYASSAASSPCAASADLSVDNDRAGELFDSASTLTGVRSLSPLVNTTHRALIGGHDPQRSSSPLKRRASSMDPEQDSPKASEDVDMTAAPDLRQEQRAQKADTKMQDATEADVAAPSPSEAAATSQTISSGGASPEQDSVETASELPPVEEQVKTIEALVKASAEKIPQAGDEVYLVSRKWLGRAQAFGDAKHASKELLEGPLGPVDNADILDTVFTDDCGRQFAKLQRGTGLESFELFPKEAWQLIVSWYGLAPGQIPIVRTACNTGDESTGMSNVQFEFHPPVFIIHRLWSANSPLPIDQQIKQTKPPPAVIVASRSKKFNAFLKDIKKLAGVSLEQKVRVWRVPRAQPAGEAPVSEEPSTQPSVGISTPPDSPENTTSVPTSLPIPPGHWPEMLLDVQTFLELEKDSQRVVVEAQDQTNNANYNGKLPLSLAGLSEDEALVLDEEIAKDVFVSTFTGATKDKALVTRGSSSSLAVPARPNASGRNSPAPSNGPVTRGRSQQKPGRTRGCVGLVNMGNTCYMNSALQCVRSVEELTKYFLTGEAYEEINPDNPLSHNGDVAKAYGALLSEIYKLPTPNTITPRQFKTTVGRYAPSFSGFGQQDSQEFVGFLLDGLQEDLNRIKKKPYIEKPDSTDDMINNPAAIKEMADKVWDITKKRDDSVIADLFTGMYKSTLICPVCDKISITFDPFNNLTLPLPVENPWSKSVKYFPLNDSPVEIVVDIDKNSSLKALKQYISDRVGVPTERLFGGEEFRDKFFKLYLDDFSSVGEDIATNDVPTMHELEAVPTNTVGLRKHKKQQQQVRSMLNPDEPWVDPRTERLLVPVVHRLPNQRKTFSNRSTSQLPPPHFVIVTREEAESEEAIRRKVLEKVATFTTFAAFHTAADEADTPENTDTELVNTSSDVDSAGDPKVVDKSVDSEEDMVDVTMNDVGGNSKPSAPAAKKDYPRLLKQFNKQRPKWVNPTVYLQPEFQNAFELGYFKDADANGVPTGWSSVSEDVLLPRLSSRAPKPAPSDTEMRSPSAWENSDEGSANEEDACSPADAPALSGVTRMADESSEEEDFPKVKNLVTRQTNGHGTKNNGKKRLAQQQRLARQHQQEEDEFDSLQPETPGELEEPSSDGGPLIRVGEGLVVDWSEAAFDAFFNGDSANDQRGMKLWTELERLEDPEVDARRKQRQARRKNGISLDDCLAEFEKEEILSEQDTWYCPRCKEHRRASKKFDLWKTPDILVVHLKRFSSSGYRRDKLDILVNFPIENLDLTERVINTEDGKQEIYDLIAVDDHWGGLGGGHYTAFAKNFVDGRWYEYNDSSVYPVSSHDKVVSSAAYLLFYRRRSDVPLGGPKFQDIFGRFGQDERDLEEAGEGQRLGKGSSPSGSPSALTGAGLALPQGSRGLASIPSASDDPELPAYQATFGPVEADDAWNADQDTLHNSIEGDQDEGIGLPDYDNATPGLGPALPRTWNFENITGNPGSVDEAASDVAQNDNSSIGDTFGEQDEPMAFGPMMESQPDYPDPDFDTGVPQATAVHGDLMAEIAKRAWEDKSEVHNVVPADMTQDDASDKVAEIHVEDKTEGN